MKKVKIAINFNFVTGLHFGGLLPGTHYVKLPKLSFRADIAWPWFVKGHWTEDNLRTLVDPETLEPTPLKVRPNSSFEAAVSRAFEDRLNQLLSRCEQDLRLAVSADEGFELTPETPELFYAPDIELTPEQRWEFTRIPRDKGATRGSMPLTAKGVSARALAPDVLNKLQAEAFNVFEEKIRGIRKSDPDAKFSYDIRNYSAEACSESDYAESARVLRKLKDWLLEQPWIHSVEIRDGHEPYDYPTYLGPVPRYRAIEVERQGYKIKESSVRLFRGSPTWILELADLPSRRAIYARLER